MSSSLRDQLLQAGLVSQQQVKDAERRQQRETRQSGRPQRGPPTETRPSDAGAKTARDQALNRRQREKAEKKALAAQIRQLIEQNALPRVDSGEEYHFVEAGKVRHIAVDAAQRGGLTRGDIMIVRHDGRFHLVPATVAARIRERDEGAVIGGVREGDAAQDQAYSAYVVPDDLIW